ncbi:MAG: Sir2 family NAD-dependent protein deacetylase [Bacteroidota bacterium]|nr:Sir2 family NAD-dependent protein deacetylase [Bacteroidota bacterium]
MQTIVILTGAGISAESGVSTFRDSNGLWENHAIEEVASPQGWYNNQELVLKFYNLRRKQLYEVEPNRAHYALVALEKKYDVRIITQNVDDLHERAGSQNVLHLHGEIKKSQSTKNPSLVYDIKGWELKTGDCCELGSQLRPYIVWFGESVPMIEAAAKISAAADIYIVIGTSLNVYPAAGLLHYVPEETPIYLIDPKGSSVMEFKNLTVIKKNAGDGVPELVNKLLNK